MDEFIKNNLELIISAVSSIVAIIVGLLGIQRYFQKHKIERMQDQQKIEVEKLKREYDNDCTAIKQNALNEYQKLKTDFEKELKLQKSESVAVNNMPLVQEIKMVYVKYLHIRKSSEQPVYQKFIDRLEENIDVHSEYHYYRFNKYNRKNDSITITDRSSGIVEQNILYPYKKQIFTDKPSQKIKGMIAQDVNSCDTCFSVTTYYNGFKEDNEDIGMKMEMDTLNARMVADFSSIVGLKRLFLREPDAYKIELDGKKVRLLGLEKNSEGIYHLEATNLKKGESLLLDFHVNWSYLNES